MRITLAGSCLRLLLAASASLLVAAEQPASAQKGPQERPAQPLVLENQGSFFVGGRLKHTTVDGNGRGLFGVGPEDDIMVDQMYVQYEIPKDHGAHTPVVMIHGCCLSGKTWETTPDGRMGWGEYFLRRERPVYIPDQPSRGRSGFDATAFDKAKLDSQPASGLPRIFTAGRNAAWKVFRFGPEYPAVYPDEQFPVAAFEELAKQVIPDLNATLVAPNPTFANLASLGSQLRGAVLIGHSESGFYPERAALMDASGVRGAISIEGQCPAGLTPQQLATLAKVPTLIVFGDHIADSPVTAWANILAGCRQFVQELATAGGDATLLSLPDAGLKGSSHMLMQDLNNLKIADLILDWIDKHVERSR